MTSPTPTSSLKMTPSPHLKYLACADYGEFTIPSASTDSLLHYLGSETRADIHIRPGGPVVLHNGSIMKGFKWRYTISVDMWGSKMWNNKTSFFADKPAWISSMKIKVSSNHDLGANLAMNGILGVPYGWGTIDGKYCYMNDGALDWEKTREDYKNKGTRVNFGFDVKTSMDGEAWQLKEPVKSGRTLRSGRVLQASPGDADDFAACQRKISIDHANSVKSMIFAAAEHAQLIIDKAYVEMSGFLTRDAKPRCVSIMDNKIKKTALYSPPKRELREPSAEDYAIAGLLEAQALVSGLEEKVKEQDSEIKRLRKSNETKEQYIRVFKENAVMSMTLISEQSELLQLYTMKRDDVYPLVV